MKGGHKGILDIRRRECRWVVSPGMFCAAVSCEKHDSWCEEHYKIVYVGHPKRKDKKIGLMKYLRIKVNF